MRLLSSEAINTAFAAELRRLRKQRRLSQTELANLAEIGQSHVSYLERGERMPTLGLFMRLCQVLDVPFEDMIVEVAHRAEALGAAGGE